MFSKSVPFRAENAGAHAVAPASDRPRQGAARLTRLAAAALAGGLLTAGAWAAEPGPVGGPLVLAASNASTNALLVFDSMGRLLESLPTQGQGGVGGNAGGVTVARDRVAVVNFGSNNVSVFVRDPDGRHLRLEQVVPALGSPVSVAFGAEHLYILTTTQVESHRLGARGVSASADGATALLHADGSAAQVGALRGELILSEKSNAIESVALDAGGAVAGPAAMVAAIPDNVNAPFGLAARGDEAYVTIAHANEISLVRHDTVLTTTGSGTQSAPCWVALDGPFLFSANSPSHSVSRYAVYGQQIVQDAAVVAQFSGSPTDIAARGGLAAVVDGNGTVSHVSVFGVDEDGNFSLRGQATLANPHVNGVAIMAAAR